ncbi:MAG TPA: ATP-binding protein [Terriglobales bacterium]|nr:ATP-binding protein [Terriglobales bacterium]
MKRVLLSWSSGKDSAWSLHLLRRTPEYDVVGLLTTFNGSADRVAMHGVRRSLVRAQAAAAGLPLWEVELPWPCSNEQYESAMKSACARAVQNGIECVAFGDLFLTDIRAYREKQLSGTGLEPLFPVWGIPTTSLAHEMMAAGLRAKLTCVDSKQIDPGFAGREFDAQLLSDLSASADPCGENGEFHSFVYAGPMFREPIPVEAGEIVQRGQFFYADLVPAPSPVSALP